MMSVTSTASDGGVASGSVVALAQSVAAAGVEMSGKKSRNCNRGYIREIFLQKRLS